MGNNKEYYVVRKGRNITRPTIYSSWGSAHLRVTGVQSSHRAFHTFQEAKASLGDMNPTDYTLDIRSENEQTSPKKNQKAYYAVAHGRKTGIEEFIFGKTKPQVETFSGCCFKAFCTREQAESFIADWEKTLEDIFREEEKRGIKVPTTRKAKFTYLGLGLPWETEDERGSDEEDLAEALENITLA